MRMSVKFGQVNMIALRKPVLFRSFMHSELPSNKKRMGVLEKFVITLYQNKSVCEYFHVGINIALCSGGRLIYYKGYPFVNSIVYNFMTRKWYFSNNLTIVYK